jgi:hypothetical protein
MMSNVINAKEEVLMEAIRSLMVADNSNTGNPVREIHYYAADRIFPTEHNIDEDFPQFGIVIESVLDDQILPTGEYFAEVISYVKKDYENSIRTLLRMDARVLALINKKHASLNAAVISKNLRCRLIVKMSSLRISDPIAQLNTKRTRFRVTCDDETID